MSITKSYRIRYWLECLETRSSPLFSTVRAYLQTDSLKRLIAESAPIKDGKLAFQAQLDEDYRSFQVEGKRFCEAKTTVLLEFGAEGRFIKMGETQINLAELLNEGRSGEMQSYRVEKCYDRNARINLKITFYETTKHGNTERQEAGKENSEVHSRSHCQLPPAKVKIRGINNPKMMTTQYEQLTDRQQREEEFCLASDRYRTLNRTEVFQRKQSQAPQELLDLKTENRIYQHQIVQMEQRFREMEEETQGLRSELEGCRGELSRVMADCEAIRGELFQREQHKETQREQSTAEVSRMLKLYQESEQERNKLLIQRQEEAAKEKQRTKDVEKRIFEERSRIRQLERDEQSLRKKIEEYMSQIAVYEKAFKSDQKWKEKAGEALQVQRKVTATLKAQLEALQQSNNKMGETNSEIQSELQISKFSLCELEKEAVNLRRINREQQTKLQQCEAELRLANETLRSERNKFAHRIEEIKYDTECEQRNMEAYLEELEIKTSNEHSQSHTISSLRREVARLKQEVAAESERAEELEAQLSAANDLNQLLEGKLQDNHIKIAHLSRQHTLLESQIKAFKQQQKVQKDTDRTFSEQEKEEIISICYQERDEVWKREVQALETDTKALMEKTKREKEEHVKVVKKLNEELYTCQENLRKSKNKIKQLTQGEEKLRKTIKDLENKCLQAERTNNQHQMEYQRWQHQITELHHKMQSMQELEEAQREAEKKATVLKQEFELIKSQIQREKQAKFKLRADVKQLISAAAAYLGKSDKQRAFFDQLRCQHIDAQLLLVFNSCAKLYCERHNRLRGKLEELQELRGQLQNKEKECQKINQSLRDERRSQGGSCDSMISRAESHSTTRINIPNPANSRPAPRDELEVRTLRREVDDLRAKLRKEGNRHNDLERDLERTRHSLEESADELRRVKEESEAKNEQLNETRQKLRVKQRQLQAARQELKEMNNQISILKGDLDEVTKAFKQEKSQILKRSFANKSFHSARNERPDDSLKILELEKRLRQTQDELDRLKRDKDERRNDNTQNKQTKAFEARLKEKEDAILALRNSFEEQREKAEQLKELHTLKIRKLKEEFEEQLQNRVKAEKELTQSLSDCQEKLRQLQKKLKISEEGLKSLNTQLASSIDKEEKAKKMAAAEWQIKLKARQGDLEAQITALNRKLDDLRLSERAAKEGERRKEKEAADARLQLERSERAVSELTQRLELCGVRLKNMEQEESNYKEVIGALQSKMKADSSQGRRGERDIQHQGFDSGSNFSLKTFTFR